MKEKPRYWTDDLETYDEDMDAEEIEREQYFEEDG